MEETNKVYLLFSILGTFPSNNCVFFKVKEKGNKKKTYLS